MADSCPPLWRGRVRLRGTPNHDAATFGMALHKVSAGCTPTFLGWPQVGTGGTLLATVTTRQQMEAAFGDARAFFGEGQVRRNAY